MKVCKGNIFNPDVRKQVVILATTNGTIYKSSGGPRLVMGGGAAKGLLDALPGIDLTLARNIMEHGRKEQNGSWSYGVAYGHKSLGMAWRYFGGFQTKVAVSEDSTLEIISNSVKVLEEHIKDMGKNGDREWIWKINYPGIGLGGLKREQVEPLISHLPDCVEFYLL